MTLPPTSSSVRAQPAHPFLDSPRPLAFAHRGGTEVAPENTMPAFRAAVDLGFRYLETDVHLTADGVLVAFHDENMGRITDRAERIANLSWAEVRSVLVAGAEAVPTFDELLEAFPTTRFNVDPKADASVLALLRALRRHKAFDRVCIGAFSDSRLARLRSIAGPALCTSAGPREIASLVATARMYRSLRRRGPYRSEPLERTARFRRFGRPPYQCVQVPVRHRGVEVVTEAFVDLVHARGCQVHVWTIDDPLEMHRLLDLGVDGLMTDRPSVLKRVLEARREWPESPSRPR